MYRTQKDSYKCTVFIHARKIIQKVEPNTYVSTFLTSEREEVYLVGRKPTAATSFPLLHVRERCQIPRRPSISSN